MSQKMSSYRFEDVTPSVAATIASNTSNDITINTKIGMTSAVRSGYGHTVPTNNNEDRAASLENLIADFLPDSHKDLPVKIAKAVVEALFPELTEEKRSDSLRDLYKSIGAQGSYPGIVGRVYTGGGTWTPTDGYTVTSTDGDTFTSTTGTSESANASGGTYTNGHSYSSPSYSDPSNEHSHTSKKTALNKWKRNK